MSLARDIVDLAESLEGTSNRDLFSAAGKAAVASLPESSALVARVGALARRDAASTLLLCLQSLRIQHDELRPRLIDAELVATLPADFPGIARPTGQVVREMIAKAR